MNAAINEALGQFYLGRAVDPATGEVTDAPLLYDARDLTTHGLCVGMTGSGKTGLCVSLLEEAALDGVPAIVVDPKGDLTNLLLTFPELAPSDFAPWIDPDAAARHGRTVAEHARAVAKQWTKGLSDWGQDGDRIGRLRAAADFVVYTPGSTAGRPLSVLGSFAAPPASVLSDPEALGDRIDAAVSGLLTLVDIDPDPVASPEYILLANVLDHVWREGRDLTLADLIRTLPTPPFDRLGVFDLESLMPAKARMQLAMRLNNLLASPNFAAWMQGDALDVNRLLRAPDGRPRVSVLSIAHLSEPERMFFVTRLLGELLATMRTWPGTGSLRALLYMDEIAGYFPPSAMPPSKRPMLTLLKQARAFGLGIVLATQNPVDLDYKGLSNIGTWFIGRLQTERDRGRLLDGLLQAGAGDRGAIEAMLDQTGSRVFLQHNVHEDAPVLFHTRWAMSYLRGPLSRAQLEQLVQDDDRKAPPIPDALGGTGTGGAIMAAAAGRPAGDASGADDGLSGGPPVFEDGVESCYWPVAPGRSTAVVYTPALLTIAELHYTSRKYDVDHWTRLTLLAEAPEDDSARPWEDAERVAGWPGGLSQTPEDGARFSPCPAAAGRKKNLAAWEKQAKTWLYQNEPLKLFGAPALKLTSTPEEDEAAFRGRVQDAARAERDRQVDKLRQKYGKQLERLQTKVEKAEERLGREADQLEKARTDRTVRMGTSVLGALFGRKLLSVSNVNRAGMAMRSGSKVDKEEGDVERAREALAEAEADLADLEAEASEAVDTLAAEYEPEAIEVEAIELAPKKTDLHVEQPAVCWRAG